MTIEPDRVRLQPDPEAAVELSARAAGWCQMRGIEEWQAPAGDLDTLLRELPTTDALVVLGGDGTFLRAARAVAEVDVPILGHQPRQGRLPLEGRGRRPRDRSWSGSSAGDYTIDERMALEGRILRGGRAAIGRARPAPRAQRHRGRPRLAGPRVPARRRRSTTRISPRSSPTASSWPARPARPATRSRAGGPILDPVSRNLVVTPIAAYLSAIRSVVVSPEQVVRCRVVDAHEALVSVDGREDLPIAVGDVVEVRAMERPIRLIEPTRRAAVLGPAPPQGGAAAVVSEAAAAPGRLLELTVTDLALIDRLRLDVRRRAQRHHRRDRGRQEPADRRAGAGAGCPGGHDARAPRGGGRAGRGPVRPRCPSR